MSTITVTYIIEENPSESPIDNTQYSVGQSIILKYLPTSFVSKYPFRVFTSWNTSPDGSGSFMLPGASYTFNQSITLYAMFTPVSVLPKYTVTYNQNAQVLQSGFVPIDMGSYIRGSIVTVLPNSNGMTRLGYTFSGWNTEPDGSGFSYQPNSTINYLVGNTTLYAIWEPSFSLIYSSSIVTPPIDSNKYGLNQPAVILDWVESSVPNGVGVSGWNTASDGSGTMYQPNEDIIITGDTTLYLITTNLTPVTYTITYNLNGGIGTAPPTTYVSGYTNAPVKAIMAQALGFSNTGYNFTSWNTASNGSGKTYNSSAPILLNGNITLYAIWTQVLNLPVSDVLYNTGVAGGNVVDSNNYPQYALVYVYDIDSVSVASKTGFMFMGWNTASDGSGTTYKPGDVFAIGTTNVTLYAIWQQGFSVTYQVWNDSNAFVTLNLDSKIYYAGDSVILPEPISYSTIEPGETPVFVGYTFDIRGVGPYYQAGQSIVINSSIILYLAITFVYPMTYYPNGALDGTQPTQPTVYRTEVITLPEPPNNMINDKYSFAGWNTSQDGTGTIYQPGDSIKVSQSPINLYAQWVWSFAYGRITILDPTSLTFGPYEDFLINQPSINPSEKNYTLLDTKLVTLNSSDTILVSLLESSDNNYDCISEIQMISGSVSIETEIVSSVASPVSNTFKRIDIESILFSGGSDPTKASWNTLPNLDKTNPIPYINISGNGVLGIGNLYNNILRHRTFLRSNGEFLSFGAFGYDNSPILPNQNSDIISPRQPYDEENFILPQTGSNIIFKSLFLVGDNVVGVILGKNYNNIIYTQNAFPYLVYKNIQGGSYKAIRGSPILIGPQDGSPLSSVNSYHKSHFIGFNINNGYSVELNWFNVGDGITPSESIVIMENSLGEKELEVVEMEQTTYPIPTILFDEAFVSDEIIYNNLDLTNSTLMISTNMGVFYSVDQGITWILQSITKGLPSSQANAGFISLSSAPQNSQGNNIIIGTLIASTSTGLYVSSDGGETWVNVKNGLSGNINSIGFN